MTDNRQSGGKRRQFDERVRQFGDKPSGINGDNQHCVECEAMLTDAFDGALSPDEQVQFDRHAASCAACGELVADARRGAAWLELLRDPAPEPPADLMERILVQTSWSQIPGHAGSVGPAALHHPGIVAASFAPAIGNGAGMVSSSSRVIAFPRQAYSVVRRSGFGQIMLQPRLAMTAAMAFFSIALTLNITGIHPTALRVSDLEPAHLRRDFFSADARVVQYYEGLRVVYELESRVHDLQSVQDTDSGSEAAPTGGDLTPTQPAAPSAAPIPNAAPSGRQPGTRQRDHNKAPADPHTSRREDPIQTRRMAVAETLAPESPYWLFQVRLEKRLA